MSGRRLSPPSRGALPGPSALTSVAVLGLGASGEAAVRLALSKGAEVHVSDLRTDAQTAARGAELESLGAHVELGRHDPERAAAADLVVSSPGIPPDAPILRELAGRSVTPVSEPELAVRFYQGPLIAVTGTNGKTTTTLLVAELLRRCGMRAVAGGNVGGGLAPAASALALVPEPQDWYVLEMSSFQLAGIDRFRPDIGVVTSLSPDHLDRYPSVDAYFADKARLFLNADEESRWVLPAGDEAIRRLAGDAPGKRYRFGLGPEDDPHACVLDGHLAFRDAGTSVPLIPVAELPLLGRHNVRNALAAALTARLAGCEPDKIAEGLRAVRPLPHRMEPVADVGGVLWVNDSKATNVAATASALESGSRPLIVLLGGKDKGEPFAPLAPRLRERARVVVAYGAAGRRIAHELGGAAPSLRIVSLGTDFEEVVAVAADLARPGDVVLLSPACSSFDMFEDYTERGRRFRSLAEGFA